MQEFCPFDPVAAQVRREKEPAFRRFPSLWTTIPAGQGVFRYGLGGIRAARGRALTSLRVTDDLESFFSKHAPQTLYPYVWVQLALNPIPDSQGKHEWLHEVMVSYNEDDMPMHAPIQYDHGKLICCDLQGLWIGKTNRINCFGKDLVTQYPARAYLQDPHEAAQDEDGMESSDSEDAEAPLSMSR